MIPLSNIQIYKSLKASFVHKLYNECDNYHAFLSKCKIIMMLNVFI